MRSIFTKISLLGLLLGTLGATTACNTIAGAGEDVSAVGRGVTKGADTTAKRM